VHDNPHHHAGQAAVVRAAAADGRPVVVAFEMLDRDQQAEIDAYAAKGGDAAGFAEAVAWRARGWPDPASYQPLFEAVFAVGAEIVAADLPKPVIRQVGRDGLDAAPDALAARFSLRRPLDPAAERQMRDIQFAAHCGLLPESAMGPMVAVQRLRDAALAEAVLDARSRAPAARVVLIAGGGHVRNDHGVGALLRRSAPDIAVLTVGFGESAEPVDRGAAAERRDEFDIFWITGPAERPDPCAEMKRQMGR
jgi:uncharacterized iron-regulated protein